MKRTLLAIAIGAISTGLAAGVLAQETDAELNEEITASEEPAAEPGDAQEEVTASEEEEVTASEEELPDEGTEAEDYEALDNGDDTTDSDTEDSGGDTADSGSDTTGSGNETNSEASDAAEAQTEPSAEQAEQAPQAGHDTERDTEGGFEEREPTGVALDSSIASLQVNEVEGMTVINTGGDIG